MRLLITLSLLFPLWCGAQKKDTVMRYLDEYLQLTSKKQAVYYGLSVRQNDHWLLYALYPDTTPVVKIYFKDKNLKFKDGPYEIYYPKNVLAQKGNFIDNKMNGTWLTWYSNGKLKDSGNFHNQVMTGFWKTWNEEGTLIRTCNYKDEISKDDLLIALYAKEGSKIFRGIKEGTFSTYYKTGEIESTGNYSADQINGEWRWYNENGSLSTIEQYSNGKLTSIKCFDLTGKETGDFCSISKPALLKSYGDYKQFVMQNLDWPEEALRKGIEGNVKVKIKVNKTGKLESLIVECNELVLKKAVENLFKKMGEWEPAVSHNRAVDWEDEMLVPFFFQRRD